MREEKASQGKAQGKIVVVLAAIGLGGVALVARLGDEVVDVGSAVVRAGKDLDGVGVASRVDGLVHEGRLTAAALEGALDASLQLGLAAVDLADTTLSVTTPVVAPAMDGQPSLGTTMLLHAPPNGLMATLAQCVHSGAWCVVVSEEAPVIEPAVRQRWQDQAAAGREGTAAAFVERFGAGLPKGFPAVWLGQNDDGWGAIAP